MTAMMMVLMVLVICNLSLMVSSSRRRPTFLPQLEMPANNIYDRISCLMVLMSVMIMVTVMIYVWRLTPHRGRE